MVPSPPRRPPRSPKITSNARVRKRPPLQNQTTLQSRRNRKQDFQIVATYQNAHISQDPDSATITLADGTVCASDLIVAADGVHSKAVSLVTGQETAATPTGFSAFRFLIPTEEILADERTRHFLEGKEGEFKIFVGEGGRRLVWYPCRG